MSELTLSAIIGPAHRNNGGLKDVVAHIALYEGGSGVWVVSDLHSGASTSIRSMGNTSTELFAVIGLAAGLPSVIKASGRAGPHDPAKELSFTPAQWRQISKAATDASEAVSCVVTGMDGQVLEQIAAVMGETSWSGLLCAPNHNFVKDQWKAAASQPGSAHT